MSELSTINGNHKLKYKNIELEYNISGGNKIDPNTELPTIRTCWLYLFRVNCKERGKGYGTKVLLEFCDILKKANVKFIHLHMHPCGKGTNKNNLKNFYLKCGFQQSIVYDTVKFL